MKRIGIHFSVFTASYLSIPHEDRLILEKKILFGRSRNLNTHNMPHKCGRCTCCKITHFLTLWKVFSQHSVTTLSILQHSLFSQIFRTFLYNNLYSTKQHSGCPSYTQGKYNRPWRQMVWVVNATPRPVYNRERDPVHILKESEWASGPLSMGPENLTSTGFRTAERSALRESLYRPTVIQ